MKNIIIAVILSAAATSCNNMYKGCKNMPEQTIGTGEIIATALLGSDDSDEPFDINEYQPLPKEKLIINSDSENVYKLKVSFDNGATFNPIDFSKYTLLGNYAYEGCMVVFDRNVIKNRELQKYIYKIKVFYCGLCKVHVSDMNFVLIPKIEDGFSVEFIVESERVK